MLWEFDGLNTLAILLWSRKNEGLKLGLFPRIWQGSAPEKCLLKLIREYMARAGLQISDGCTKKVWKRSQCEACGRLFRNTTAGGKRVEGPLSNWLLSANVVRTAVKESLERIG
eukprot:725661-Rhodomonas_salina.1